MAYNPTMPPRFDRDFFRRDPVRVARAMLGQRLVRVLDGKRLAGVIVETEAYLGISDQAAHTFGGRRTKRNESMWGDGGHAYVYFTYGMHHCVNVVAGRTGQPVAVLLRALEPVEGLEVMRGRRLKAKRDTDLCSGPAKLTAALAIDRELDGADLVSSRTLFLECLRRRALPGSHIAVSPRIGIDYAKQWKDRPLRFYIRGNPHVSR
jgi:DNA-3-methyladenine glycosylase